MLGKNKNRQGAASAPPDGPRKASLSRHKRGCAICRHPHRAEIEYDFLHWRSACDIAEEHKLYDRRTVYRHAHALDLWQQRRRNLRAALESLIEGAGNVKVTAGAIVRAVIAHGRINDEGKYVEPPRHSIISRVRQTAADSTSHTPRLENGPTD